MAPTGSRSSLLGWSLLLVSLVAATVHSRDTDSSERPSLVGREIAPTRATGESSLTDQPIAADISGAERAVGSQPSTQVEPSRSDSQKVTPRPYVDPAGTSSANSDAGDSPNESATTTTTTATTTTTTTATSLEASTTPAKECETTTCFNNGVCRVMPDGSEKCFCPDPFWGARCQLRNICKSTIADNLTGEDICRSIGRHCIIDDKLFRCECDLNEFFLFKADYYAGRKESPAGHEKPDDQLQHPAPGDAANPQELSTFVYDAVLAAVSEQQAKDGQTGAESTRGNRPSFLAECRKVDECLGVRCRQRSEVCENGRCVCNKNLGFIQDPTDGLCKLLNPCTMPAKEPICGEAKCLPTYNQELFKCVCPIGYYTLAPTNRSPSYKCAPLQYNPASSIVCLVPLLNKCQHMCELHNNSYRCTCFKGYRRGERRGIDDHLCFFMAYAGEDDENDQLDGTGAQGVPLHLRRQITFEPIEWEAEGAEPTRPNLRSAYEPPSDERGSSEFADVVRRVRRRITLVEEEQEARPRGRLAMSDSSDPQEEQSAIREHSSMESDLDDGEESHRFMSAQERCNVFCDENKICTLEDEASGIYRCTCDRQGYVSVGDKCLDWCSAAEFSHSVRFLLDLTCATGLCKRRPDDKRPPSDPAASYYNQVSFLNELSREQQELVRLVARSSWRPSFQCDCSSSPFVYEDPTSRLCQLNFSAILEPCLPGNEGHTDCVVNKHAYCAVLHKDPLLHNRGLTSGQLMEQMINQAKGQSKSNESSKLTPAAAGQKLQHQGAKTSAAGAGETVSAAGSGSSAAGAKKAKPVKDKPYVCVCSPEKKFLVDKPRNKARCVDECDLLSNECGRFNRMCRAATISSNDQFGNTKATLVREDQDGVRMNQFKRTGCECLPGFNVGPSEPRDFTLDSNYPDETGDVSGEANESLGTGCSRNCATAGQRQPLRFGWDLLESLLVDANILLSKNPAPMDQSVLQNEFVAVGQDIEHLRRRYMNIDSRCLLDYDVVEFHARFRAPVDFEPSWVGWARRGPTQDEQPTNSKSDSGGGGGERPTPEAGQPAAENANYSNESERLLLDELSGSASDEPTGRQVSPRSSFTLDQARPRLMGLDQVLSDQLNADQLRVPSFMGVEMADFYKHVVLVADCNFLLGQKSFFAYEQCVRYRYWTVQKLRAHFADWRQVISSKLRETFDLMDGNIRFRVNKCESIIKRVSSVQWAYEQSLGKPAELANGARRQQARDGQLDWEVELDGRDLDPWDHFARVDADLDCKLTIHSASEYDSHGARKTPKRVLLEKQLPKFIYSPIELDLDIEPNPRKRTKLNHTAEKTLKPDYYMMAPNTLIHQESYDQLAAHRKAFSPCNSQYEYCDKQTRCEMQDLVNYSCTCEAGYTPIGSRDIYFRDSRKEVCEDINECLFDVCKGNGLEDKSICVNEIGDYKCQCIRHHVGDNKRFCDHICNVIACKHGDCRIPDEHHAFCECLEGYREADCSVQDPSVALRKANMIICSSIFASVLLLAITLAISLNSQLKKTKKKLKRLEAAQEAVEFYEFSLQQPPFRHRVSKASITS